MEVPMVININGDSLDLYSSRQSFDLQIPYPPQIATIRTEKLKKALVKAMQKIPPAQRQMYAITPKVAEYMKGVDNQAGDYKIYVRYLNHDKLYWCGVVESQPLWIRIKDNGDWYGL